MIHTEDYETEEGFLLACICEQLELMRDEIVTFRKWWMEGKREGEREREGED